MLYMEKRMFRPRQYGIELGAALLLYLFLLLTSDALEHLLRPTGTLLFALSMAPTLGAVAVAWVIMRALRRMDELQRRVQFDAIATAFLGTALITIGWGFAENAGAPHIRAFAIWPLMALLWLAGMVVACRRYR